MTKIMQGDCLKLMGELMDNSVDMVFTDLPYGITRNDWDKKINLIAWWQQIKRICKENAAILLMAQIPFSFEVMRSNIAWLKYEWIYHKPNPSGFLNAKKAPLRAHENILVFYKAPPVYNPQKTFGHKLKTVRCRKDATGNYGFHKGLSYHSTERYPVSVQSFKTDRHKIAVNRTQKPVAMIEYFIKTYTNVGQLVLDTCAGSGATGIAAENINRDCILMDLNPIPIVEMRAKLGA